MTTSGEALLLELLDGFLCSKVLMTAYRIDLFTRVAATDCTATELLEHAALPERSGTILLDACLALGLLETREGRLRVPDALAPYLVRKPDAPFHLATYLIGYYEAVYADLVDMEGLVRSDSATSSFKLRDYFKEDVAEVDRNTAEGYAGYMAETMREIVGVVLETCSFADRRFLVDLCGATGEFSAAVLGAHPHMNAAFVDVPAVIQIARENLASSPLQGRIVPIEGDVFQVALPAGVDVVTMCRSAHDWDDVRLRALFRRVYEALLAGGRFLVVERMLPDEFDPAGRPLYLRSVYFLSKSRTARYRTPSRYSALLAEAGFERVEVRSPARDPNAFFRGMKIVEATKQV